MKGTPLPTEPFAMKLNLQTMWKLAGKFMKLLSNPQKLNMVVKYPTREDFEEVSTRTEKTFMTQGKYV